MKQPAGQQIPLFTVLYCVRMLMSIGHHEQLQHDDSDITFD